MASKYQKTGYMEMQKSISSKKVGLNLHNTQKKELLPNANKEEIMNRILNG